MDHQQLYIGLMCGTSLDAIDAALISVQADKIELVAHHSASLNQQLTNEISDLCQCSSISIEDLMSCSIRITEAFAGAVNQLLINHNISAKDVIAIGHHGITVRHRPDVTYPFSLQIGEPNKLTQLTGIDVISDFRNMDIALGGQGAPLVPPFHQQLFSDYLPCVLLNLGGIANITVLNDNQLLGYDTGPANTLMNYWCERHTGNSFDQDGAWAASGKCIHALLEQLLSHPYFAQTAPKSTGKEDFNLKWLDEQLSLFSDDVQPVDVQTTLSHLTARSVAEQIQKYDANTVYVCGGGVLNSFLMLCLQDYLPHHKVLSTDDVGINSDQLEAMAFAWFAHLRVTNTPIAIKSVTNASANSVLGAWYSATREVHE